MHDKIKDFCPSNTSGPRNGPALRGYKKQFIALGTTTTTTTTIMAIIIIIIIIIIINKLLNMRVT